MLATREDLEHAIPYQILVGLISAIGGVGILRLWLSRSVVSVGEALPFALMMAPTMIAIQILLGLMIAAGALILLQICQPVVRAAGFMTYRTRWLPAP